MKKVWMLYLYRKSVLVFFFFFQGLTHYSYHFIMWNCLHFEALIVFYVISGIYVNNFVYHTLFLR